MMVGFATQNLGLEPENFTRPICLPLPLFLTNVTKKFRSLSLPGLSVNPRVTEMPRCCYSSPARDRTWDLAVNSRSLYLLSYRGMEPEQDLAGLKRPIADCKFWCTELLLLKSRWLAGFQREITYWEIATRQDLPQPILITSEAFKSSHQCRIFA